MIDSHMSDRGATFDIPIFIFMKIIYASIIVSIITISHASAQIISWTDHSSGISFEWEPNRGGSLSSTPEGVFGLYHDTTTFLKKFDWQGVITGEIDLPSTLALHQLNDGHLIAGTLVGSLDLLGTTLTGGYVGPDVFFARLDAEGSLLWARNSISEYAGITLAGSAVSPNGKVVLLMGPGGQHAWGEDTIPAFSAGRLLLVFDEDGTLSWHKELSSELNFTDWYGQAEVAINDAGDVWLAAMMPYQMVVGSDTIHAQNPYNLDHLIAHFSADGSLAGHVVVPGWQQGPGIVAKALVAWPDGRAFWGGYYRSGTTIGDSTLTTAGQHQGLFLEIGPTMEMITIRALRSDHFSSFAAMAADPSQDLLYLTGTSGRHATFEGDSSHVDASYNAFVIYRNVGGGLNSWTPLLYSNDEFNGSMWPSTVVARNGIVHTSGHRTGLVRRMDGVMLPLGHGFLIRLDDAASVSVIEQGSPTSAELTCWPSPATGAINVALPKDATGYHVIGVDGRIVLQGNVGIGRKSLQLDLSQLRPGTYVIQVNHTNGFAATRFMIE
jgi:hypothetical protein